VLKTLLECIPESLKNHLQSQIFSKNYKTNLLLTEFLIIIKQGNVSSQELVRLEKELFLNNFVLDESLYNELFIQNFGFSLYDENPNSS